SSLLHLHYLLAKRAGIGFTDIMCNRTIHWLAILLSPFFASAASAQNAGIDLFEAKIRPVLIEQCFECHAGKKSKGGLSLHSREALILGGNQGTALIPGDADKSLLIRSIRHTSPDLKM